MNTQDITALLLALGTLLGVLGAGAKWLLTHVERKTQESANKEAEARKALSDRLLGEIAQLRGEIIKQQLLLTLYLKRIYVLEHCIQQQPGMQLPKMDGWPPS